MKVRVGRSYSSERAVFLGDSHVDPKSTEAVILLSQEIARCTRDADLCVIVGDLFDYWMGPSHLNVADCAPLREVVQARSAEGVRFVFVPGNRDFLFDAETARDNGMEHGGDWVSVRIGETTWLAHHGDLLCRDDRGYLAMRLVFRSAPMRFLARRTPASLMERIANRIRRASQRSLQRRFGRPDPRPERLPVRPETVRQVLEQTGAAGLVCGHFHRKGHFQLARNGCPERGSTEFLTLPTFLPGGRYVAIDAEGPRFFRGDQVMDVEPRCTAADAQVFDASRNGSP